SYNSTLLAGTPVTGITTDINGDLRHPLEPYMGCDEHYFGERPWVAITNSPTGILTEDVLVSFRIFASDSPACTIKVEYTTDGGATWVETTSLVGATTGLASSPAGVEHSITWKPIPDIGETDATCQLRITVRRDSTPDKWGTITGVTGEFSLRNAPAHAVIHYPAPADEGWVKSYGTLADGTFLSAVDGSFYIGTHSSGSGRLSIGAGISGTDNRNYVGGWQNPNTDIPYLEGNVYIAKFKVSTNQANTSNVPNTRLYAEFINSAGSLAAAGGNRVGKGPFAPNAAGNTYNVYVQGAANMNPDIQYIRLKFEVLDFDPAEWGTNTLEDVDVYRFEPAEPDPARKIATFMPPFNGWTGVSLSSPFGNATFGSNTTGLWIETPGPTAGANRTVDYALWQIAGASSGVAFEADRLYRSVWTISVPNTATEGTCARIRMIAGNQANNWGAEFVADPAGGYREHMPTVAGVEYSVWQETLPLLYSGSEAVLNNMSFLFDVADGREDQSGRIYLKKVDLFYYDIP
ncbi:MAG TPA: hypothetical protein PLB62_12100, partial [Candidatus Sumerlaeota bacterium]|nr:hypothetical protein [Candidatus Sumerlaeota bacterium]